MKRREFLSTAAITAIAGISKPSRGIAQQPGFTFYSPMAEEWFRGGKYFEWTSTTQNNKQRRVKATGPGPRL